MDTLNFSKKDEPGFQNLWDISILKMLHQNNLFNRKILIIKSAYAWYALAIAKKHDLQCPIWASNAMMDLANQVVYLRKPADFKLTRKQVTHVEDDIKLLKAISEFVQKTRKPITMIFTGKNPPTPKDVEARYAEYQEVLVAQIKILGKTKALREKNADLIYTLKKDLAKQDQDKDKLFKTISRKMDVPLPTLKKAYYSLSEPKNKGAKKTPTFSLSTPFPDPFSA